MDKGVYVLIVAIASSVFAAAFWHYSDCHSASLGSYSGWVREQPRFYGEEFGEIAPRVRDHVGFVGDYFNEVTLLSGTDLLFRRVPATAFFQSALAELRDRDDVSGLRECGLVSDDVATWACADWTVTLGDAVVHQRAYFTARGNSKFVVFFSASPPEFFSSFGDPRRWLRDTRWCGPGIRSHVSMKDSLRPA